MINKIQKTKYIKIIGVIGVVVAVSVAVYVYTKSSGNNSSSGSLFSRVFKDVEVNEDDLTAGEPYLKMTITDYTKSIADMCQEVSITFEAENVGDTTLKYTDLENNYYFGIASDDAVSSFEDSPLIGTFDTTYQETDYAGLMPYTKIVSDFGEIAPGEKKTVVYRSINYIIYGQHEYSWINCFNNIINGNFSYYIEFGRLSEKGSFYSTDISKSPAVNISTNLQDSEGGWKYCEYELITDESIDFYE